MASPDIIIVGSGAGGGTLARALMGSGAKVLMLERGVYLPSEPQNWSPEAIFQHHRYRTNEQWEDARGRLFRPGVHYWVGGNTKVYGAALPRLRAEDFDDLEHEGGTSPTWPISYEELEPYYRLVERWYRVHGEDGIDPTEPPRSTPFPFPAIPGDSYMNALAESFHRQGMRPYPLPLGIDYGTGGKCIRCRTCDAFPCQVDAKSDAATCGINFALADPNFELRTNAYVRRLLTDSNGSTVNGVDVEIDGSVRTLRAGQVVVAAGACNSAALLLRSANSQHPNGLGNRSDQVGRNYMAHNMTVMLAGHPELLNGAVVQKSFAINDFYFRGPGFPYPMGNLQPVGKVQAPMLKTVLKSVPDSILTQFAARTTDWNMMSEDLPDPENRVTLGSQGRIRLSWRPNNLTAHHKLVDTAKAMFREAGYPVIVSRTMGIETNSHQVGTIRMGADSATSVLDHMCKAHDLKNLYVVDGSFFPSSTAVNPALTIMAQAVRVATQLGGRSLREIERSANTGV